MPEIIVIIYVIKPGTSQRSPTSMERPSGAFEAFLVLSHSHAGAQLTNEVAKRQQGGPVCAVGQCRDMTSVAPVDGLSRSNDAAIPQ